jgi:hypothetical protein
MKTVTISNKESRHSSFREEMFEHRFIAELMEHCWESDFFNFEVLHSEIDNSGYDLLISIGDESNYLQFKVTKENSKVDEFPIHGKLINKKKAFILLSEYSDSELSICKRYLMRVKRDDFENGKTAVNSHNKSKIRPEVKMIKRSIVKSTGEKSIRDIFTVLNKK